MIINTQFHKKKQKQTITMDFKFYYFVLHLELIIYFPTTADTK